MLALNKKVGLLSIQSAKLWKVLYFDQRGVSVYHNVHRILDRVVAGLVRTRRLTEVAVDEVRDHAARMGQPLTDSLLAGGYLEPSELEDQYRIELEEDIYDLFFCRDAKFEFHEGASQIDGREGSVDERFFFNCDSVIMEAARRIDEWAYISERVPTTAEVFVATADTIDSDQFGADGPAVFELLDGRRNVARIIEITGLSNFQVCKVLSQLLDAEVIAPVATEEVLPLAVECMAEGRLQDAINLYERAIGLGVGLPEVHSQAAKAYQAAEEYENAIYHLECEAAHRQSAGDRAGAAQRLLEVKTLVPTSLQARERLVELTLGENGIPLANFDPLAEGKELVDLLIEFGDIQRVRSLLERLLLVEPNDPDLKKALVNVHVKAGDQKRVAELYESIAEDLVKQDKPLEAVAYLQKILLVDRSRVDVSERVRKLYEFDERSRRRGRALSVLALLFCLLLVLGCGYWFYNERAEEDFARIDLHELVAREDFAGASTIYEEFMLGHPLTTAVAKAEGEMQQIEAARQRFEARRSSERAGRENEINNLREQYKLLWTQHREQFLAGHPEDSLRSLTKVRELVAQAGAASDVAWAAEQQIESSWRRLREFLDDAEKLAADHDALLAAGDWPKARERALRLHADFGATASARRVQIPVLVSTRPTGAVLLRNGIAMERTVAGKTETLLTPALVSCAPGQVVQLLTQLDGFEPRQILVDGKQAQIEAVLEVVADRRITFDAAVQTGVGLGEGWLAVGLRGGRLGLSRTDGTSRHVRGLSGLKAVDSTPVVQNGRVFFTTNENTIECLPLDSSQPASKWPVTVAAGVSTEIMVGEGRVAVIDRESVLQCWEQAGGSHLWSITLDSAPSGPCTIDRRQVHVGTVDGRVLILDATDGKTVSVLRSPVGISTRVLSEHGTLYFGCSDGNIRAVDSADGRVLWVVSLGRTLADGEIALGKTVVVAFGVDGKLVTIDRSAGKILRELQLDGTPQRGLRVLGQRALVQLRRQKTRTKPTHDVLQSIQLDSMALQWEYADSGLAPGVVGIDDFVVGLPSAGGEVILFR